MLQSETYNDRRKTKIAPKKLSKNQNEIHKINNILSSKYSTTRLGIQNSGIISEDMATCKVKGNMRRSGIRSASRCSDHVKQSLQRCYLKDNRLVLEKCLKSLSDLNRQNNIKSLIYILDVLMAMTYDPETCVKGRQYIWCFRMLMKYIYPFQRMLI